MDCIHCGNCTRHCDFLTKYHLDLEELKAHPELSYHCFLCGECTASCPADLDGTRIVSELRARRIREAGGKFQKLPESGPQKMLLLEKEDYIFRNYRGSVSGSVLFPGCNFPSFYPETTKKLIRFLKEEAGIGVVMDCCGKPVADLGMLTETAKITASLENRLREHGVTELVVLCPNCYYFLRKHLTIPVVTIYEKLKELKFPLILEADRFPIYLPCPDRKEKRIYETILPFLHGKAEVIHGIQCCGLGGCAASYEPEIAAGFSEKLKKKNLPTVYTYCASCVGNFNRNGCAEVCHILPELLKTYEKPPAGIRSLINRASFRFRL